MDRHLFAKKRVSLAVSLALGAVAASPVMAQDGENANGQMMEEVVVTGIRSSLKRAMDTKRDATGVVDAITAEDIGDFPDTNLAEALQRITGVAIDRDRGEGARVTVRGFGADFNLVTLNGPPDANAQWSRTLIRLWRHCLRECFGCRGL
jgi:outer membrane receptor for ferrienterochelin and colicin